MLKQQKGITLVALVITIVVLIIIAGVVVTISLKDRGIFTQAQEARNVYQTAANKENEDLTAAENEMNAEISKAKAAQGTTAAAPTTSSEEP